MNDAAPAQNVAPPAPSPSGENGCELNETLAERRRYPRYKCAGSVELRKEGTTVRTWGTFTDLSQSGCYVEMQATFPPETNMELVLELNGIQVRAKALVRVTYPFLGMGLVFTSMADGDRLLLGKLLQCITGTSHSAPAWPVQGPEKVARGQQIPAVQDHRAALQAVLKYFDHAEHLSREQFMSLLRTSQSR